VALEGLITAVIIFCAVFVLTLAILNQNLFVYIFGKEVDDNKEYSMFAGYVGMPARKVIARSRPEYAVACEICGGLISSLSVFTLASAIWRTL